MQVPFYYDHYYDCLVKFSNDNIILLEDLRDLYTKRKQATAIKRLTREESLKYINDVSKGIDPLLEDKEKAVEEERVKKQKQEAAERERQKYLAEQQKIKEEQLAVEKEKQRKETEEIVNRIREDQERRKVAREKRTAEELALILYLC